MPKRVLPPNGAMCPHCGTKYLSMRDAKERKAADSHRAACRTEHPSGRS